MNRSIPSRLAASVLALVLAASTPVVAQRHFPSDEAVREIARQAGAVSGKVGIVIGELEADGSRRVITIGDPANNWVTTEPYTWLPTVMVAFAILGHIVIYRRVRAGRD